ncbi:O-antigen polymerase [Staphylococcus saprophyticus]|nr:O-antigen polymerase [Staphylococcus saprophyticus]
MVLKTTRIAMLFVLYILFHFLYLNVLTVHFSYEGFTSDGFEEVIFFEHIIIITILILLQLFMKNEFYNIIYNLFLIMIVFGQSVVSLYIGNNSLFLFVVIPQFALFLLDIVDKNNFKIERKQIDVDNKYFNAIAIIFAVIILMPFLKNIGSINLSNLLFNEIYDTRSDSRGSYGSIINYLYSSIARVVFPFLLIFFWVKKKYVLSSMILVFIVLLFLLNGAVKSILIGAIAAIGFYFFRYKVKNFMFILMINMLFIFSLFENTIFTSYKLADYIRRIFYLPGYLFNVYYEEFHNNFTYYGQTALGLLFGNKIDSNVASYIGESVLGRKGMVANVGIFAEGYISLGIIGVFIATCVLLILIFLLKSLNFNHRYFGLIFTYIYIINTSFLETLLITHGMLFLLIFGYFFIPQNDIKEKS